MFFLQHHLIYLSCSGLFRFFYGDRDHETELPHVTPGRPHHASPPCQRTPANVSRMSGVVAVVMAVGLPFFYEKKVIVLRIDQKKQKTYVCLN